MLPILQSGRLLGLTKGLLTPRTSWLGRSVTTKAPGCDPKCPKIELSSRCCRTQDDDDDCLVTDPQNFWFPGNIYHNSIPHVTLDNDISDSDDSSSD